VDIETLDRLILEGQEKLAKFEETVGGLDWEPERCVHLLNLMCGHLNELIREREKLVSSELRSSH
jgi:hypothetical protein